MLNLVLSLGAAAAAFVAVFSWMGPIPAVLPALLAFVAAMFLLGRRINRKIDAAQGPLQQDLQKGRVDAALTKIEALRPLARWQILLGPSLDSEIGILLYAHKKDFEKARPYLEKAPGRVWQAKAMLAAYHFRKKQDEEMVAVFEKAVKKYKKAGLLWSAYAWCLWKRNRAERAIQVLLRGKRYVPSDQVLARNLEALQNKKKMNLKGYGPEWWAMRLEEPPRELTQPEIPPYLRNKRARAAIR